MSRSHNSGRGKGGKHPTYEYWSKRPYSMSSPGRSSKNITKSMERMDQKEELIKELKNDAEIEAKWLEDLKDID